LAAIVAAAIAVRIPSILHEGLWRDEAYVYVDLIAPTFKEFFHRVVETEYHPPLYFLLVYVWVKLAGISEISLKTLPLTCSILTVLAVYRLGRIAGSRALGLLAAAMYALSPVAIEQAGNYVYPPMALLCTVLAGLVMSARREPLTPTRFGAIAGVAALAFYTHYAALFYVPMLMIWAFFSPKGLRHGAAVAGALLLGFVPFVLWVPTFLSQRASYHVRIPDLGAKLTFLAGAIVQSTPVWTHEFMALFLILAAAAFVLALRSPRRLNPDASAMGAIFIASLLVVSVTSTLNIRYIAIFESLWCVFLASLFVDSVEILRARYPAFWRPWGVVIAVVLCVVFVFEDATFARHTTLVPKSGIRTFVAAQPLDRDTLYAVAPDYMTATFAFYARDADVAYTGVPNIDHPEIFRFATVSRWRRPGIVEEALANLQQQVRPYSYLDLIVNENSGEDNVKRLEQALAQRYALVWHQYYSGKFEPITVYRFRT